jgi:hypothetical protein
MALLNTVQKHLIITHVEITSANTVCNIYISTAIEEWHSQIGTDLTQLMGIINTLSF